MNYLCLKYTIHEIKVEIVFWTEQAGLGKKSLFLGPLTTQSRLRAARAGQGSISLAQEQGHII